MKYIKNQFAKVVFLFLVISLIVTGMLKLADHDFIYSLSILFGCSSPAPLTLKICFFMFVILAQYFNADGFIFYENCKCKLDTCTVEISSSERRA